MNVKFWYYFVSRGTVFKDVLQCVSSASVGHSNGRKPHNCVRFTTTSRATKKNWLANSIPQKVR